MSEHRIAWTLHNFEMEQTIIRLRNTRNRLLDRNNGKFPGAEAIETYRDEIRRLENENASLADRLSGAELERDRIGAELERELNEYKKKYIDCSMALEAINQLSECKVAIRISNRALSNETKPTET